VHVRAVKRVCVCVCIYIGSGGGSLGAETASNSVVSAVDTWTKMTVVSVDTGDVDVAAAITALACLM